MSGPPSIVDFDGGIDASLGPVKSKTLQTGQDSSNTISGTSGSSEYSSSYTKSGSNSNVLNSNVFVLQLDSTSTIKWEISIKVSSTSDNETSCTQGRIFKPKTGAWRLLDHIQSTTESSMLLAPTLVMNQGLSRVEIVQNPAATNDGLLHHAFSYRFVCHDSNTVAEPVFI
jgi:hypothetical protein